MRVLWALLVVPVSALAADAPDTRQPANCIDNKMIGDTRFSPEQGYFAEVAGKWWQNRARGCPLFAPDRTIITNSTINRQCNGDQVTVFQNFSRIDFGACVLGKWQPVAAKDVPPPANRSAP